MMLYQSENQSNFINHVDIKCPWCIVRRGLIDVNHLNCKLHALSIKEGTEIETNTVPSEMTVCLLFRKNAKCREKKKSKCYEPTLLNFDVSDKQPLVWIFLEIGMWNTSGAGGQAFFLLTGKLAGYCRIHYANKATFAGFRYIKALSPCSPSQPHPLSPLEKSKAFTIWTETSSLFSPLNLCRDPIESLKVMALWLWLEQFGFNNIVKTISSLPHFLINEFADEAMLCINYLSNSHLFTLFPEPINLPLTQSLLGADVPSNFFPENRVAAILGIRKTLTGVCLRALSDLLQKAIERNTARALTETQISMSTLIESGFSRLNINNFGNRMSYIPRVNKPLGGAVHPDDRTMFVTFSKGYPVSERDIREFFNLIYGDCIESLHMREVQFAEQSLYARIVFNTPNVIKYVLNGAENTKFTVKGRHMWVRKFVPNRRRHISLSPCMPGAGSSQGP